MKCSLGTVIALIVATIVLLVLSMLCAGLSSSAGYPFNAILLFVAAGLAAAATALMRLMLNEIQAYQRCRDDSEGLSSCSIQPSLNIFTTATLFIGAISFLAAAALELLPIVGEVLNMKSDGPRSVGIASCGIAIGLLAALIGQLKVYESCRDQERSSIPVPSGPPGSGPTPAS